MNALFTRPLVQQAISVLMSAMPSDLAKSFRSRPPASSPGEYGPFCRVAFGANVPSDMYERPHQYVTHFPKLVSAFGERTFAAYWH